MYYRLSEDIKNDFIDFFQTLFSEYGEGKLILDNSKRNILFSQTPICRDLDTYDLKTFPTVGVSTSSGNFKQTHFNSFRGSVTDQDSGLPVEITGGIFNLTLNFQIFALTKSDRNNLSDIVGNYLSKRDTKLAFLQAPFSYRLMMPTFSGDGADEDPQTNVKYFYTTISMEVSSDFEDMSQYIDQFGNTGLTVRDIISLMASNRALTTNQQKADGETHNLF